jgi:putative SOS response-associated peptidase YedK
LINARAETVVEKPSFRAAYKARRCIVPASGFFEWAQLPSGKQPYFIYPAVGELLGLAGLWEPWSRVDGETLDTFKVITTDANAVMRPLHGRMPVILAPQTYGAWLSKETAPDIFRSNF